MAARSKPRSCWRNLGIQKAKRYDIGSVRMRHSGILDYFAKPAPIVDCKPGYPKESLLRDLAARIVVIENELQAAKLIVRAEAIFNLDSSGSEDRRCRRQSVAEDVPSDAEVCA